MSRMTNDEKDAEAALLALGSTLTWIRAEDAPQITEILFDYLADAENGLYSIAEDHTRRRWKCTVMTDDTAWYLKAGTCDSFVCKSLAAAKSSCERHHATGKWI